MFKLTVPDSGETLFESVLEPNPIAVSKLRKNIGSKEGTIEGFKGKKNKVSVGVPYYENLLSRMLEKKEEISHEITQLAREYEFHYVCLSCSFLSDHDCRFEWARFGVQLSAIDIATRQPLSTRPVAYQMIPDEVTNEYKMKREVSFSPELKIVPIVGGTIGGGVAQTTEYIVFEPQITGYGLRTPNVVWDFKRTKEKGISGNKQLQLIIQAPKSAKVKGKFLIGAEVSSSMSRWLPVAVSRREDNAINVEYDLSS
jgi:hypothetical protein